MAVTDKIANEHQPVTPAMALRFARMFGGGPEVSINMQRVYDLKIAGRELGDALDRAPESKTDWVWWHVECGLEKLCFRFETF